MEICVTTAVTLWVAALVTSPRRPLVGNEVQELVYRRLLGRQHLLVLCASAVTAVALLALILSLPTRLHGDLVRFRTPCQVLDNDHERCFVYENGRWAIATPTPVPAAASPVQGTYKPGPRLDHGLCDPVDRHYPPC